MVRLVRIRRLGTVRYSVRPVPYLVQFLAPPLCLELLDLGLDLLQLGLYTPDTRGPMAGQKDARPL